MSKKNANGEKEARTRNWACVVYPESAPENWKEILSELHVAALVSPLHDSDLNPTGEKKKPHYHVLVMYDGPKEQSIVSSDFQKFGGVGCEYVKSARGYARYLCHLDNPEKAQYSQDEVVAFGGACFNSVIGLPSDKYKAIREMVTFCQENVITAYCDLFDYAMAQREDWFTVLCDSGTYVMKEYIKSQAWKYSGACEDREKRGE